MIGLGLGLGTRDSGLNLQPGRKVLLKTLLGLQAVGDNDDWPGWKSGTQERGEKGLGCRVNAHTRQCAALLQSPRQGLHSGSLRNPVEQVACRRDLEILRQAWAESQWVRQASSFVRSMCGVHSTILGTMNKPLACAGALRMASS